MFFVNVCHLFFKKKKALWVVLVYPWSPLYFIKQYTQQQVLNKLGLVYIQLNFNLLHYFYVLIVQHKTHFINTYLSMLQSKSPFIFYQNKYINLPVLLTGSGVSRILWLLKSVGLVLKKTCKYFFKLTVVQLI